jgi:hypothetical protein
LLFLAIIRNGRMLGKLPGRSRTGGRGFHP